MVYSCWLFQFAVAVVLFGAHARHLNVFRFLSHSQIGSRLKRRAACATDHGGAVAASERIFDFARAGWAIKNISGRLLGIVRICHKCQDLANVEQNVNCLNINWIQG